MIIRVLECADPQKRVRLWLDRLPPFPMMLNRLLATMASDPDDVSFVDLTQIVEMDTVIAGRVLGVANSSFYGRSQTVSSIHQAVVRLGVHRLRNVVLTLSINRIWGRFVIEDDDFSILRFNRHALATAILADLIAQRQRTPGAEVAFVAGLFHDIGQLVLVSAFPGAYLPLLKESAGGEDLERRERELLTFTHSEISAEAIAQWRLPESVQAAVRFHEQPIAKNGRAARHTLRDVLHVADRCAGGLGISLIDRPSKDNALQEALAPMGMSESDIGDEFLRRMAVFDQLEQRVIRTPRIAG